MTNSDNSGIINHEGIVQNKNENTVLISITSASACSGCHAEGSCSLSGSEEKIIEVRGNYDVKPGDKVTILMKQSMGYAALFLGYILPLFSVIAGLIILISVKIPELTAGLFSLSILIPYYSILFLFRKRINKKFTFTLKV
jgi:sigma-E factor negative regulatory protein RseC